ncbi:MAG: hypothetical protein AVDCRST_MAG15-2969, partial [uncultured Rubellimicrobium sp.]
VRHDLAHARRRPCPDRGADGADRRSGPADRGAQRRRPRGGECGPFGGAEPLGASPLRRRLLGRPDEARDREVHL